MERARRISAGSLPQTRETEVLAMTVSSVIKSLSLAKAAGVCALGLGLTLGGCNNKLKDENAALMGQNQALIAENNEMRSASAAKDQQIAELAARANNPAPPVVFNDAPRGNPGPSSRDEVFVVAGDVLFDSGQTSLKSSAKKELDGIASEIKSRHSGQRVRVEGYTDSDPIRKSKWPNNEALSEARAEAVRIYLVSKGVPSARITSVGMGAAKPKATKKDSRRVEIVVVGN
jgi:chemotaxis protein MotB